MESELTLQAFDIVVVPFPFTDRNTTRRRPALVVSGGSFNQALWQPWIKKNLRAAWKGLLNAVQD